MIVTPPTMQDTLNSLGLLLNFNSVW
jgi:ribosomal protein L30/L7E